MKLILFFFLEDDEATVRRLLDEHGVVTWSRLSVEGHGQGAPGWYGDIPAYRSGLVFTLVPDGRAAELLSAVRDCTGCKDPAHPVHALTLSVEEAVTPAGRPAPE